MISNWVPLVSDYVALFVYSLHVGRDKNIVENPNTNSEQLEPYD